MLTFSNNVEPANGFLVRYLRRKLLESDTDINANKEELLRVLDWVPKLWYHLHTFLEKHSTSDFLIGMALPHLPPLPWGWTKPSQRSSGGADMFPVSPRPCSPCLPVPTNHSWWVIAYKHCSSLGGFCSFGSCVSAKAASTLPWAWRSCVFPGGSPMPHQAFGG